MPNWCLIGALCGLGMSLAYCTLIAFYTLALDDLRGYTLYGPDSWIPPTLSVRRTTTYTDS